MFIEQINNDYKPSFYLDSEETKPKHFSKDD